MPNILRIGTDCSGIEAPIQALKKLKIPFRHVFSSDIDKYVIQSIKANYKPEILYGDKDGSFPDGDITKRDNNTLPDIDLYVCGFPCQTFSQAGKKAGISDKRGIVFWSCLDVIKTKQPQYFLLENVKGLLGHNKGETWEKIWNEIKTLEKYGYNVYWKILNTKDYGIPQNRPRLYIVGTKKSQFEWPENKKCTSLKKFIDNTDNYSVITSERQNKKLKELMEKDNIFIDFSFGSFKTRTFPFAHLYCNCITVNSAIWCIPKNRYANIKELLKLQGFPIKFKQVISNTQMKKQIGNSMSVNVICDIFSKLL